MRQCLGRPWLRTFLLACALLVPASGSSQAQSGEGSWLEALPGFGRSYGSPRRTSEEDPRRRGEVAVDDLRPDATPFRSDVMVQALEYAIERYQEIVARGGWPQLPGSRMIRPEDDDERIPLLRRRLMMSGELSRRSADAYGSGYSYGADLEAAVRRFQVNHGLRVSGRVDKPTLDSLNVPAQARLSQLRLNLQRLRDLGTQRTEDRYILVNVPAFQLEAVERYQVELRHRVIAGKPERQTPAVRATIKALNFFPYWRVPESVAALDLIPRLAKEPDYLEKEQIRVLSGNYNGPEIDPTNIDWRHADAKQLRFRQDPGPQNALGLVRLDMPNEHGVYMHDTPMKQLFSQRGRSFSAGCVRVQDVFTLAEWVARQEPGWEQPGRAREILETGNAFDLNLTRPVPVYFVYITAWAEPNGDIQFRPDIYGRDGMRDLIASGHDPADGPPPAWRLAP
jgi:L,D-transpeptidase YcbB